MSELRFEWDERKNTQNRKKHGVSFEEAQTVFFDEYALLIADPDSVDNEDRFILLGVSSGFRTLMVCHCLREENDLIRLISAREANGAEQEQYRRRRLR